VARRCDVELLRTGRQKHSELLIAMLDALLKMRDSGSRIWTASHSAMGRGRSPAVRIACGAAQGLAFGASLPVAGICTLEALVEASGQSRADCGAGCADGRDFTMPRMKNMMAHGWK